MKDDYSASSGWDFFSMTSGLPSIRLARHRPVCALILACALVSAATAHQQSSSSDSTANKPATKNSTATHHKTTAKKTTTKTSTAKGSTASGSTKSANKTHTASSGKRSRKKTARTRGQQKIDSERAEQIQAALIREHYLTGEPTGTWNTASEEAMRRYQADHGWQTKEVPDSRALIKLGLGPSKDGLLNPESAMTTSPEAPKATSLPTTSHSAATAADPVAPVQSTTGPSTTPAAVPAQSSTQSNSQPPQ
jgi:hypothetical protein